jgi:hypothetical protein
VYLGEVQAKELELEPDRDPDRYLALTARMFDGYNADVAQRLKQRWCALAATATTPGVPAGLEAWTTLNPAPPDAIEFVGTVTSTETMQTPEVQKIAIHESLVIVIGILLLVFPNQFNMWWLKYSIVFAIVPFLLYANVKRWWQYFRACNSVTTWNQRGWISPLEFAILKDSRGVRISLGEVDNYVDHDSYLEITTLAGSTYFIARDQVASDADWTQVVNACRGISSKTRCHVDGSRSVSFSKGSREQSFAPTDTNWQREPSGK